MHRGLEVAALDERDEEEVLVELVDDTGAQLRVPLPGDATAEPPRVVGILGEAPEVAPASKAVRAREALAYLLIDGVLAADVCTGLGRARSHSFCCTLGPLSVFSPWNCRAIASIWPPKRACEMVTQPETPAASSSMLF